MPVLADGDILEQAEKRAVRDSWIGRIAWLSLLVAMIAAPGWVVLLTVGTIALRINLWRTLIGQVGCVLAIMAFVLIILARDWWRVSLQKRSTKAVEDYLGRSTRTSRAERVLVFIGGGGALGIAALLYLSSGHPIWEPLSDTGLTVYLLAGTPSFLFACSQFGMVAVVPFMPIKRRNRVIGSRLFLGVLFTVHATLTTLLPWALWRFTQLEGIAMVLAVTVFYGVPLAFIPLRRFTSAFPPYRRVRMLAAQGGDDAALQYLEGLGEMLPGHVERDILRAKLYFRLDRLCEAEQVLLEALSRPRPPRIASRILEGLGQVHLAADNRQAARRALEACLVCNPRSRVATLAVCELILRCGQQADPALAWVTRVQQQEQRSIWQSEGVCYHPEIVEAIRLWALAIVRGQSVLGPATECASRLADLPASVHSAASLRLGWALGELGDIEGASTHYETAVQVAPKGVMARLARQELRMLHSAEPMASSSSA